MTKKVREPLFHLVKRTDSNPKRAWLIRIAAFVFSVLLCAIVTVGVTGEGFDFFFKYFFKGVFGSGLQVMGRIARNGNSLAPRTCGYSVLQNEVLEYRRRRSSAYGCVGLCCDNLLFGRKSQRRGHDYPCVFDVACLRYGMGGYSRAVQGKMEYQRNAFDAHDELYRNLPCQLFHQESQAQRNRATCLFQAASFLPLPATSTSLLLLSLR